MDFDVIKPLEEYIELKNGWSIRKPLGGTFLYTASLRFDPVTIAIIAGTGLMAYGQVREGQIARAEGKAQKNIAEYNAAQKQKDANAAMQAARLEDARLSREQEAFKGKKTTQIGKSGFALDDVSSLEVLADDAFNMSLDRSLLFRNALLKSEGLKQSALYDIIQGKYYEKMGKYSRNVSYIKAGGTILSGVYFAGLAASAAAGATAGAGVGSAASGAGIGGAGTATASSGSIGIGLIPPL